MDEIENLILAGAVEVAGIDEKTGEFLYNFTDKIKDVMPDLHREHMNNVSQEIMYFWERGFLLMNDITSKNPIIMLADKAFDDKEVALLPQDKQEVLANIKKILKVV